jgi:hypothetical protein
MEQNEHASSEHMLVDLYKLKNAASADWNAYS